MTAPELPGLSQVVCRGDLRLRTDAGLRRINPTLFDKELLTAVDAAAADRRPIALVLPLPAADTPIVLGAASLSAEIVRSWSVAVSATVVSARLSQRTLYDRLYVRDSSLVSVIPRARITADGDIVPVGEPYPGSGGGRMILTGDPQRVPDFGGSLVIDGTGGRPIDLSRLLRSRPELVYITDNPFDEALAKVRDAGGVVWAFDPPTMARLATSLPGQTHDGKHAVAASPELLAAAGTANRQVLVPACDAPLDEAMRVAWNALRSLTAEDNENVATAAALGWAWSTFHSFALSATSPDQHDRHVPRSPYMTRLADSPAHARAIARNRTGATRKAWLALTDSFDHLLCSAADAPKLPLVQRWLVDLTETDCSGLLVTRNRAATQALVDALEEHTGTPFRWHTRVRVVSLREVLYGRVTNLPVDSMLLTGPVPRSFASMVAAPGARQVVIATAGVWEASRAARQARQTLQALTALRQETTAISAPKLRVPLDKHVDAPEQVLIWRDQSPVEPAIEDGSPWEPFTFDIQTMLTQARGWATDNADLIPPGRDTDVGPDEQVSALHIIFTGNCGLLLAPNDPVYRSIGTETRRVAAKALVPGDVVALVDTTARRDLFNSVINVLASINPEYHLLTFFEKLWHIRVDAARDLGLTYQEVLSRMQSGLNPTQLTTEQTIRNWFKHNTVPLRAADVHRFAVAVGDSELAHNSSAIGDAFTYLRTIHQAVGRWLSAQINGVRLKTNDALVDPQLRVHVADLLDAVTLHQVADVAGDLVMAPAATLGVLSSSETIVAILAEADGRSATTMPSSNTKTTPSLRS